MDDFIDKKDAAPEKDIDSEKEIDSGKEIGSEKEIDSEKNTGSATENSSAAFSGWVQKLRFDRSFAAKLILSDEKVKEYYAEIASEILGFEKVRSKTSWSGVTFSAGRERFASVAFVGKTLCLYLAIDPATLGEGKYKAKNVENVKKRAKTPSMLRIKSDGGKRYALKIIDLAAENFGLKQREVPLPPVDPSHFKTDTFNNLVTRGLIRILRYKQNPSAEEAVSVSEVGSGGASDSAVGVSGFGTDGAGVLFSGEESGALKEERVLGTYGDTVFTTNELFSRHGVYNDIIAALSEGDCKASFSEKLMLRSIDEIWVRAIEDCVHSLDELIRNPNHFIAETEEVLPIELTKRITGRSVAHLCRHTDYISPNDKGEVTPTKMLNVFRDDSILTYENKFLNTLINRLYAFVGKRYSVLKDRGADERMQTLEFENAFPIGEGKVHVKVCVEYSERYGGTDAKRVLEGSGLMARVERVYAIVSGYVNSAFAKEMDKNFIRPPVMRTNAILKNKYFRECLALWEFIESYDDSGYGVTVDEKNKEISPDYAKELYKDTAMLYFMFRRNMDEDYGEDEKREYRVAPDVVMPDLVVPEEYREEFIGENADFGSDFDDVNLSLLVALAADDLSGGKLPVYRRSFAERLCDSDEMLKVAFAEICNEMSGYRSVKLRYSRKCATLRRGRTPLIRIAVAGKSLKMYFALATSKLPEKYRAKDASKFKRYADTPSYIRIKSARSLKYALRICDLLAEKYELVLSKKPAIEINPDELNYEYFGLVGKTAEELRAEAEKAFAAEAEKAAIGSGEETAEEKKITEKEIEKTAETESVVSDEVSEKVPAEVDYPPIGVSFGPKKSETVEREAEAAERLAVKESGHSFEEEKPSVPEESDEGSKVADLIESLERVDSDYGKPTDFGIDDSSGFISDERRSESGYGRRKNVFGKRRQKK